MAKSGKKKIEETSQGDLPGEILNEVSPKKTRTRTRKVKAAETAAQDTAALLDARTSLIQILTAAAQKKAAIELVQTLGAVLQNKIVREETEREVQRSAALAAAEAKTARIAALRKQRKRRLLAVAAGSLLSALLCVFAVCLPLYFTGEAWAEKSFLKKYSYTAVCYYETANGETVSFSGDFVATRTRPAQPYKEGFRFDGWFFSDGFQPDSKFDDCAPPPQKQIVLYGKWIARHTVLFETEGANLFSPVAADEGEAIPVPSVPIASAPLGFDGWHFSPELYSPVQFPFVPTGSVTLYAHWRALAPSETVKRGGRTITLFEDGSLWEQSGGNDPERKLAGVRLFSAGISHTLAVDENGRLWVWGTGFDGRLGDGTYLDRPDPIRILPGKKFMSVAAGEAHSLAVDTDGNLFIWGANRFGQLGDGTFRDYATPRKLTTDIRFKQVAAGDNHSVGLDADGRLYTWGDGALGQIGNGFTAEAVRPELILSGNVFQQIGAAGNHTVALDAGGNLYGWGCNRYGQLNSAADNRFVPEILQEGEFERITTGEYFVWAAASDGTEREWGVRE